MLNYIFERRNSILDEPQFIECICSDILSDLMLEGFLSLTQNKITI